MFRRLLRAPSLWIIFPALLVAQSDQSSKTQARKALDLLLAAKYAELNQMLTANAKEKLTVDFLRDTVSGEVKGFGKPEQIGDPVVLNTGTAQLVSFPVQFSNTKVNVQFTVNDLGHIAGIFFRPADEVVPPSWKRPPYSRPEAFHEREVTIGSDEWRLGGTLTMPNGKGPFAAVVLVHGPGPNDRNESIFTNRIFEDLAEGLASSGFAVLRYDKRTKVYAEKMGSLPFTIQQETVEDAVRALALVRRQPEIDSRRVFVLGHSLGGYIVPRIAKQDAKLAGAILLAGNARHIEDVSLAQTEYTLQVKGGPSPAEHQRLDQMKQEVSRVKALQAGKDNPPIVLGLPVEYFLDLRTYDPVAEAMRLGVPMLFLQGERDFQVTMEDFRMWKSGLTGGRFVFRSYPALNHLFIPGEGQSSTLEYRRPGNVSPDVVRDIAGWLRMPPLR